MKMLIWMSVVIVGVHADNAALLIVDVQDCFVAGGSLAVTDGNDVIPVINEIRNKHESVFSLVVFTQDWHCVDHISFASQHEGHSPYEEVTLQYDKDGKLCYGNSVSTSFPHAHACAEVTYNVTQMLWPDHCIKNVSSGKTSSSIDPEIMKKKSDITIRKGDLCEVDSYSVFYDNGGFRQTSLNAILKRKDIDTVYITGLALDYCVYYTSIDATKLGYNTFVIADATRGVAPATTTAALADMVQKGVNVIQSSSLESILHQVNSQCRPSHGFCLYILLLVTRLLQMLR